jgi:hypothetical protein
MIYGYAVLGAAAKQERRRIRERTMRGRADAKVEGVKFGQPASSVERSPRLAPARWKISSQAVESNPSRRKMAPPSVGSAGAAASAPANGRCPRIAQPFKPPRRPGA